MSIVGVRTSATRDACRFSFPVRPDIAGFFPPRSRPVNRSGYDNLVIVKPEAGHSVDRDTVTRWHPKGFRLCSRAISKRGPGLRRIIHFNATTHPTARWVMQQLREAFPDDSAPRYLIFDNHTTFADEVLNSIEAFRTAPKRTAHMSPWQKGVAERWVG